MTLLQTLSPLNLDPWPEFALALAVAVGGALVVHGVIFGVLHRIRHRTPSRLPLNGRLVVEAERPSRWALLVTAVSIVLSDLPEGPPEITRDVVGAAVYIGLVASLAWLAMSVVRAVRESLVDRLDLEKEDNLSERRILTQAGLLQRVLNVGIIVVALAAVLLHFETFRRIGTGLLASAGIAGIVLGFAAQRVLGNLFAGIQIAITQPIRVDDVVVVEGEWARVEEITLTYVVLRVWDLRRLVLPISYFIEKPFQNWTRQIARVIGEVYLRTDFSVSVEAVRKEVGRIVEASRHYDGGVWKLHVTELGEHTVEMRAIMTTANADSAWELRCEVREHLLTWLQTHHPDALPRTRVTFPESSSASPSGDGAGQVRLALKES